MIMEVLNTILGVANAVNTISNNLGSNNDSHPVEVIEKEIIREAPVVQHQPPMSLTININVFKDGKRLSGALESSNKLMGNDTLAITQNDDSFDIDLN